MSFERQFSENESLKVAALFLRQNSFEYNFISFGKTYKTFVCKLLDTKTGLTSIGNGKGIGLQSKASAVFEAIEHFYVSNYKATLDTCKLFKVIDIPEIDYLKQEKAIEILFREQKNATILCKKYNNICGDRELFYPVFLSTPLYSRNAIREDTVNYKFIDCYSTNSGTSTGLTLSESLIHSISELIERDAISLMLINTFIKSEPQKLAQIHKSSLPKELLKITNHIERLSRNKLYIFEITTEIQVPVFFVYLNDSKFKISPTGSGCSLYKYYALQRSLLELLQNYHLYNAELEVEDELILREYEQLPLYKDCALFNIEKVKFDFKDFNEVSEFPKALNLQDHLNELVKRVNNNGFEIFFTTLFETENVKCNHVIIPGMEKFNLVRSGNPVLPFSRGYKYILT